MNTEQLFRTFYNGRKVLVTGHNGFKGSWLSIWLHMLGAEVLGISLDPPSQPSMFDSLALKNIINTKYLDINNAKELQIAVNEFEPEVIIHMAALSLVRPSYVNPLATLHTNIMGTAHILEACRLCPSVRSIVIVTSDKCYRNNEWVWGYRENDPMGGHDPYSASKGCAELLTASYTKSFFNPSEYNKTHKVAVASARAGNAIGGGDWGIDRLIPDCFRALHENNPIHIRYPSAVRPWQHALECLSGYLTLGINLYEYGPKYGCGWNFAPIDMGDVWPVERVVKYICELWGSGSYTVDSSVQPHEAHMLCLDCTKANIELNWRPKYNVANALKETVEWYKAWSEQGIASSMQRFTEKQISNYMNFKIEFE